ncbi:MAG: hypothetical protein N3J91_14305 [Verrucomicrobiae bacterium]|nr:hypothetical protein [Verrucomicrobiae bacterium]
MTSLWLAGRRLACLFLGCAAVAAALAQNQSNLVANGSFELDANADGIPDFWQAAGDRETQQQLDRETADGGWCARLRCTAMGKDTPSSHAMICQLGQVSVERGRWYKLSFRARAENIRKGVSVGLNNTRVWKNVGLDVGFYATPQWQRFEFLFEATDSLPAENSRLQFWFKSTGTLWLDDVELVSIPGGRQWFPQWPAEGVPNAVPNGAFECGAANWGSYNNEPGGWGNQLFQLVAQWSPTGGSDGGGCLKITWNDQTAPVFYFDYFQAVRRTVRRLQAANLGWLRVQPGTPMQLSVDLRSEPEGIPTSLTIIEAEGPSRQHTIRPNRQWQRYSLDFQPQRPFIFVAVGPDYLSSTGPAGTVWLDGVALHPKAAATAFQPRQPIETFAETPVTGNLFTNPAAGLTVTLRAAAWGDAPPRLQGLLRLTDFFDRVIYEAPHEVPLTEQISPHLRRGTLTLRGLLTNRLGFYRLEWATPYGTNALRCALLAPVTHAQGAIGMNHAYPWDFLMHLAHTAGIRWWRDWSAKWHEVEKEQGQWNFQMADEQIDRVLRLGGQPLVLLPFPSSWWSSRWASPTSNPPLKPPFRPQDYEPQRRFVAQAPQRWEDFANYAAAVVRHYRGRVQAYHLLNEPIYTSYALPRGDGHSIADYLQAVESAYPRMKAADKSALIVGGIGTGPDAGLTLEFVEKGGLRFVDILDLHMYDPPAPTENQEPSFAQLEASMRQHGGPKPVWITEYGCYADDDPACLPPRTGDSAMTRARWPSERAASEHLVKYVAVTFAHGVRKLLLHAGSSAQINGPNEGGIFFEYGGQPRKMLAAVATLNRLLATPDACLGARNQNSLCAYLFRCGRQSVAIAWSSQPITLTLPKGVQARDIMGNPLAQSTLSLADSPVYFLEANPEGRQLRQMFLP